MPRRGKCRLVQAFGFARRRGRGLLYARGRTCSIGCGRGFLHTHDNGKRFLLRDRFVEQARDGIQGYPVQGHGDENADDMNPPPAGFPLIAHTCHSKGPHTHSDTK